MRKWLIICICIMMIVGSSFFASAHVPYIERNDYSKEQPFFVWKMIEKSKAFYAWLEPTDGEISDIDVYKFTVRQKPVNIYVELIVPDVNGYYDTFVPWFALIGPGLPGINQDVPFSIPEGYGGIIKENVEPGTSRETFYEPFGGKSYFYGPTLDRNISEPGTYYIYCWDPYNMDGDYVLVIGKGEFFGPVDIVRSIINTAIIRADGELHIPEIFKYLSTRYLCWSECSGKNLPCEC